MPTLNILSSVDRLPAWDNQNGHAGFAFGLNLSVALADGKVPASWLKPPERAQPDAPLRAPDRRRPGHRRQSQPDRRGPDE